jgi:hypothetical protein
LLSPDQPILSVGYAMMAEQVPDGSITTTKFAPGAIDAGAILDGTVAAADLAPNSVNSGHIVDGEVQTADLANQAVTGDQLAPNAVDSAHLVNNSVTSADVADTLTLERLNLGGLNWDGSLRLFSAPGGGGGGILNPAGSDRGYLMADNFGADFGLFLGNGETGVVLAARSPGGRLQLWDSFGTPTTVLGALNGGGDLNLFQISGEPGIRLNGDRSAYNQNSSGGEITVHTRGGQESLLLDGDHNNAGRIEVRQANQLPYVDLFGLGSGEGGEIRVKNPLGNNTVQILGAASRETGSEIILRRANNVETVVLDGEDSPQGGGRVTLQQPDAEIGAVLYASDPETAAGALSLRNSRGAARFRAYGGPESGSLLMYDANGTETIEARGAGTGGTGAEVRLRNGTGQSTIELDGDWTPANGGTIRLFQSDGSEAIRLQADYNGEGRIIADVLQLNGADLSEHFDVTTPDAEAEPEPGMVVCIDPEEPGKLVPSSKAYDRTAAGIISGAGGVRPGLLMSQAGTLADGRHPVALTGRVYCNVDASTASIEPGDLITTSDVPGHGMKVVDHARAQGAIIGKAMTGLKSGRGQILVLVSLQ